MNDKTLIQKVEETLPETWAGVFKDKPKKVKPNEAALEDQIEKFGQAFGTVKAQIVKYKLSGMLLAAGDLQKKLTELEIEFDKRIYEYLGYPRLGDDVKSKLTAKATSANKFLNEYYFSSYPRPIPAPVLEAINDAKRFFPTSSIKIWAIEKEPLLKDPVVVAEVDQNGTKRYYLIAIWDNDIQMSDLIDLKKLQEVN